MVPYLTPADTARRRLVELDAPIYHKPGWHYVDTDFVLSPRFVPTSACAMLYSADAKMPLVIRNCTWRSGSPIWRPEWGATSNWWNMTALRLMNPRALLIDGLHVEGMPSYGVNIEGAVGATLRRISATRCAVGMANRYMNSLVEARQLRIWDTWAAGPGVVSGFPVAGPPSAKYPGQCIGGDGFAGYYERSSFEDVEIGGEMAVGIKLVRSKDVRLTRVRTPSMMIEGTDQRHGNSDGSRDGAQDISIRGLYLDKRLGAGGISDAVNGLQVSWNVHGLDVQDFVMEAGGHNGHAIQLAGDVEASFRGGVISGWNGVRGSSPAYAAEVLDSSTINEDFETANTLVNQERILRRAS